MPTEDEDRRRRSLVRWPSRKQRGSRGSSSAAGVTQSMHLPAKKQYNFDDDDQPDVSAPGKNMPINMNQSIFSMLTAARPNPRAFNEDSDASEDDGPSEEYRKSRTALEAIIETKGPAGEDSEDDAALESSRGPAPVMSMMLEAQHRMSNAGLEDMAEEVESVMSEAAEQDAEKARKSAELSQRLMEIFSLPEKEEVISEYPCWLLKSVLLQGYMYITVRHICFYAYLPRKTDVVAKSGFLSKRGKSNVKFTRYWFILKGDVLSYFANPQDLYFPNGHIDLRYGISAGLVDSKGAEPTAFTVVTDQRKYYFRADAATSAREWVKALQKVIFRSHNEGDSVKISIPIENVIDVDQSPVLDFADTVKLKAFDNDDTYAIDEVCASILVAEDAGGGVAYAEKYFFSFFSFGNDALKVLQAVTENSAASQMSQHLLEHSAPPSPMLSSQEFTTAFNTPALRENIRATLASSRSSAGRSPGRSLTGSPRLSGEYSRSSVELGTRRSTDLNREMLKMSVEPQRHSIDSAATQSPRISMLSPRNHATSRRDSVPTDFSLAESSDAMDMTSDDQTNQSASNILTRSDVFKSPTIKKMRRRMSTKEKKAPPSPLAKPSRRKTTAGVKLGEGRADESDSDSEQRGSTSTLGSPLLQDIARAGTYPLQRAAGWADWMRKRSKKMSSVIATESMGYIEKVSDMWAGGRKHYRERDLITPTADDAQDAEDEDEAAQEHGDRFRQRFALPETDRLIAVYYTHLHRVLPLYGKIYLSNRSFCFRSTLPGTKTKMIVPLKDIENVEKEKGFRFGYSGLVITIRGYPEVFFEFGNVASRDDLYDTTISAMNGLKAISPSGRISSDKAGAEAAQNEYRMLQDARQQAYPEHEVKLPTRTDCSGLSEQPAIVFDDPHGSIINFKPSEPMNITCLTIGSRGDVQPFIALCMGLQKDGHRCKIATHAEFRGFVEEHGIEFAEVAGDPGVLMDLCVQHGMFTMDFMKEVTTKMRVWLDELLETSWRASQGSDLLIESPSAMAGIHIAEALGIPYFRAFTMPWTRTRAYPHAFAVPEHKMGGAYNYFTYVLIDNVFWQATASQINRWRRKMLNLPRTSLDKLQPNKVPFLYNFSPHVVVPPLDYSEWIRITGYWFLDTATADFTPPADLLRFIQQAREDGKKLVYVGFGSVTVGDSASMTRTIVTAVQRADVRCVLSKGWSDRMHAKDVVEVPMPPEIHQIKSCPHDWLFRQMDVAVHHGGAGTTGASLRAGIPTIIKPFFGDQFFFGNRVEDLGVGICLKKLTETGFARALVEATGSERMRSKARVLGEEIRAEDGVGTAIQSIYRDLEYARSLIKKPNAPDLGLNEDSEESWTFVGDDGVTDQQMAQSRRVAPV